ncbi:hypothetical protein, partial [Salmonella enterica]|uniref:hypothetical protein n=1 Tax=Salmonella enterica TaxID=28901 RepID=UPI001C388B89
APPCGAKRHKPSQHPSYCNLLPLYQNNNHLNFMVIAALSFITVFSVILAILILHFCFFLVSAITLW